MYYIHNRIDTIEFTASKLQKYLPDARILVRMVGWVSEMSEIWRKLVEHEAEPGLHYHYCNWCIVPM